MARLRWFKFFYVYKQAFIELNAWNCKKLILAICDYAENGKEPKKLNKKTMKYFESVKAFYDADKEMYKIYGAKGGRKSSKGGFNNSKPRVKGR